MESMGISTDDGWTLFLGMGKQGRCHSGEVLEKVKTLEKRIFFSF